MITWEQIEALDAKAPQGAFSSYDAEVLLPEVERLREGEVYLEIGVNLGKSLWLARQVAPKDTEVWGIDLLVDPGIPGARFIQGDSSQVAKAWDKPIGVLFIDGNHSYEGCKADIDNYYPHMAKGGVMLFHDCDATSPGVEEAVAEFAEEHDYEVFYSPNQRCSMARIRL